MTIGSYKKDSIGPGPRPEPLGFGNGGVRISLGEGITENFRGVELCPNISKILQG